MNQLLTIFENIINNPSNIKYHNLNYQPLIKKLQHSAFIRILSSSGFIKSNNNQNFRFETDKLDKLKQINNILTQYKSDNYETDKKTDDDNTNYISSMVTNIFKSMTSSATNMMDDQQDEIEEEVQKDGIQMLSV